MPRRVTTSLLLYPSEAPVETWLPGQVSTSQDPTVVGGEGFNALLNLQLKWNEKITYSPSFKPVPVREVEADEEVKVEQNCDHTVELVPQPEVSEPYVVHRGRSHSALDTSTTSIQGWSWGKVSGRGV